MASLKILLLFFLFYIFFSFRSFGFCLTQSSMFSNFQKFSVSFALFYSFNFFIFLWYRSGNSHRLIRKHKENLKKKITFNIIIRIIINLFVYVFIYIFIIIVIIAHIHLYFLIAQDLIVAFSISDIKKFLGPLVVLCRISSWKEICSDGRRL